MIKPHRRRRSADLRPFLWPGTCSICLHLLLAASLAAEWRYQPEVVWVSTTLVAEQVQVDMPEGELAEGEKTSSAAPDAEERPRAEEADEPHSDVSVQSESALAITEIAPAPLTKTVAKKVRAAMPHSPSLAAIPAPATVSPSARVQPQDRFSSVSLPGMLRQETVANEVAAQAGPANAPERADRKRAVQLASAVVPRPAVEEPPPPAPLHMPAAKNPEAKRPVPPPAADSATVKPAPVKSEPRPQQNSRAPEGSGAAASGRPDPVTPTSSPAPAQRGDLAAAGSDRQSRGVAKAPRKSAPASQSPKVSPQLQPPREVPPQVPSRQMAHELPPLQRLAAKKPQPMPAPMASAAQDPAQKSETASHRQPMPAFEAPLKGDLELELGDREIGAHGIKVRVLLREYPKNRHKKPMTKAESKRVKSLTPRTLRTGLNTVQAVIEVAPDGVYEFRGTRESAHSQEVSCTVTIHGRSSRPTVKRLENRKVGNESYIMKVLMPEGIVWEDDASFSGSIEDSDGISKYNSESGLVWKEYN